MAIKINRFGKDHWSVFGYIETRIVDYRGVPGFQHMRCDGDRHPLLAGPQAIMQRGKKYPTRLKGGLELPDHDDWDCAEDLEEAGLLDNRGTGINPVYKLTDLGREVAAALRAHKANKGSFSNFCWGPEP